MQFTIREGRKEDCISISEMIKELAVFEKMPDGPEIDHQVLEKDGFGDKKYFHTFVAEDNVTSKLIGYCLYFYKFSTWQGKFIWMEDLYVRPDARGRGVGTALWKAIAEKAVQDECERLEFNVLDWNQGAIDFYQSNGAVDLTKVEGWHTFRLDRKHIEKLANK